MQPNPLLFLCLDRDIPEGAFCCLNVFGESLIAKKEHNVITVAENKCTHRGFPVGKDYGLLPIHCPYHGLKFNFEKTKDIIKIGQMIFILNTNDTSIDKDYDLQVFGKEIGIEFGKHEMEVEAPYYLWMSNTMDPKHLNHVHKDFSKQFEEKLPYDVKINDLFSSYRMVVKKEVKDKYKQFNCPDTDFWHCAVVPNLSITNFLNIFMSIETAAPTKYGCFVTTRFFTSTLADASHLLCRMAYNSNKKILQEDKEVVERWAKSHKLNQTDKYLNGEERISWYMNKIKERNI